MKNKNTSCVGTVLALLGIFISLFWILNFTCGIFEIPDNMPIVGNLDEAFFTMLFIVSLSYLGIEIPFLTKKYIPRAKNTKIEDVDPNIEVKK